MEEVEPRFHPTGGRFLVNPYPKEREHRRLLSRRVVVENVLTYVEQAGLKTDDLLFPFPDNAPGGTPQAVEAGAIPDGHGTLTGYSGRGCRCGHCRAAYARYRARRRAQGKDTPRSPRRVDTYGHLPRRWYLRNIWKPALAAAGIRRIANRASCSTQR